MTRISHSPDPGVAWCASLLAGALFGVCPAQAKVGLPALFSHHMVLQQDQKNPVWGWAGPGENITVRIATQSHQTSANQAGRWKITLNPLPAGGPHELVVEGENTVRIQDVLVGEVWLCSGQSNMQLPVKASLDPDLEIPTSHYPNIRLLTIPQVASQELLDDFAGQWQTCSPESVPEFSAVGYFFGRLLHQHLQVPVGLIDNSWGGSSAEAWVARPRLEDDSQYAPLLQNWAQIEEEQNQDPGVRSHLELIEKWKEELAASRAAGQSPPPRPSAPRSPLFNQHRPGNLYGGVLHPILGYGLRGVIWYQGESNAGRAYQYRHLFPLLIRSWREDWQQGDFPFYWVQLADYKAESPEPGESAWAELREAQTMTLDLLPNTGEAVIIDLGEGRDIHPRNKQDVAKRLARLALARDYGRSLVYHCPRYKSMEKQDHRLTLAFDHVGAGLYAFDRPEPVGFTVAGPDRRFVAAQAKITGNDTVEVWSDQVEDPVAARYAWADNPVCNLQTRAGLPVTPFRTDDWPGLTVNNQK